MYELIRLGKRFVRSKTFYAPVNGRLMKTFGKALMGPGPQENYSKALKELVLQCLAYDPNDRPSPEFMLAKCQEVRGAASEAALRSADAAAAAAAAPVQRRPSRAQRLAKTLPPSRALDVAPKAALIVFDLTSSSGTAIPN
jgi:serine/threonine protein kinase